jgi:hypothetical protein
MRRLSLVSAAAIIVVANALALLHVARNRAGRPTAEVTLTNREARYFAPSAGDEDSGVTLLLQWTDSNSFPWPVQPDAPHRWLDRQKLQTLGFDCSVDPKSSEAERFYRRQRPRRAFVALENDGPAWRMWREAYELATAQERVTSRPTNYDDGRFLSSRLVAVDADLDREKLRARHPDHSNVLILPAAIAVTLEPFPFPGVKADAKRPVQIIGRIQQMPVAISVPRPLSDGFRRLHPTPRQEAPKDVIYHVRLRYGSELEPWVTGVEFVGGN